MSHGGSMQTEEVARIVAQINLVFMRAPWLDCGFNTFDGSTLEVGGSLTRTYADEILIWFDDVHFLSMRMDWTLSLPPQGLLVLTYDEAAKFVDRFRVPEGVHVFHFADEDGRPGVGSTIGARGIRFAIPKDA